MGREGGGQRCGLDITKHVTEAVERTPVVGQAAAPMTGALRSAIGIGENLVGMAGVAGGAMGSAASGIRQAQSAVKAGDVNQAMNVMRDTATDSDSGGENPQEQRAVHIRKAKETLRLIF